MERQVDLRPRRNALSIEGIAASLGLSAIRETISVIVARLIDDVRENEAGRITSGHSYIVSRWLHLNARRRIRHEIHSREANRKRATLHHDQDESILAGRSQCKTEQDSVEYMLE